VFGGGVVVGGTPTTATMPADGQAVLSDAACIRHKWCTKLRDCPKGYGTARHPYLHSQ